MANKSSPTIKGNNVRTVSKNLKTTLESQFDPTDKLQVGGKSRPVSALISEFAAVETHYADVEKAHARVTQLIEKRQAAIPLHAQLVNDTIATLVVHFGGDAEKLNAAGIPPRKKKRPLTAEENYAASLKRKSTREMRRTMGSRQKQAVKAQGRVVVGALESPGASGPSLPAASTASATPAAARTVNQAVPAANGANPVASS